MNSPINAQSPLPKIVSETVEGCDATVVFEITASLDALSDHFPDYPVVSGLSQLHWIAILGRRLFEINLAGPIKRLKFMVPIQPPIAVTVLLQQREQQLYFEYQNSSGEKLSTGLFATD